MTEKNFISLALFSIFMMLFTTAVLAQTEQGSELHNCDKTTYLIRWGQGGFRDSRAENNRLGGGQLALDILPCSYPLEVSLSGEYYTKSSDPTQPYEISDLYAINLLYTEPWKRFDNTYYFIGGGLGKLKVPESETNPNRKVEAGLINLEAGIRIKPFDHFGFYALTKYLNSEKKVDGSKLIDFDELIWLVGITYQFDL